MVKQWLAAIGILLIDLDALIEKELETNAVVVRAAGLKPN